MYIADKTAGNERFNWQNTGWHFIPNQRYDNWLVQRQWYDLVNNHSRFRIHSCEATVQNMIPLTDNLSIQQDTTFVSFNNTIYALGYTDFHYETLPVESQTDLKFREGKTVNIPGQQMGTKMVLPLYRHPLYKTSNDTSTRVIYSWDPFIHPQGLMELRPGKNAIKYSWKNETDLPFFDTSYLRGDQNLQDGTNLPTTDIFLNNFSAQWMVPVDTFKADPRNLAWQKKRSQWYKHYVDKGIHNWFIKMIPILDKDGNLLNHTAQVAIVKTITFEVEPRTNTTNYPQLDYFYTDRTKVNGFTAEATNSNFQLSIQPMRFTGKPPFNAAMETQTYPGLSTTTTPTTTAYTNTCTTTTATMATDCIVSDSE